MIVRDTVVAIKDIYEKRIWAIQNKDIKVGTDTGNIVTNPIKPTGPPRTKIDNVLFKVRDIGNILIIKITTLTGISVIDKVIRIVFINGEVLTRMGRGVKVTSSGIPVDNPGPQINRVVNSKPVIRTV